MKKVLRAAPLIVAACVCIALMCIGTMAAIGLVLVGGCALFSGLAEGVWDIAGFALFGLVTAGVTGADCFLALMNLADCCIDALSTESFAWDWRDVLARMLVVAVTTGQWCAVPSSWFLPVCALADVLHLAMLLNDMRKRRKRM